MIPLATAVAKVGGSLADWPGLPAALAEWRLSLPFRRVVFVAGGGALAEALRNWSQRHRVGDAPAHWLALRAMSLQSRMLAHLLPWAPRVAGPRAWRRSPAADTVFDLAPWFRSHPDDLPKSWDVTSDSLAAWLAVRLCADRLYLLKSCPPTGTDPAAWSAAGQVDRCFPVTAASLETAWICLRPPAGKP